ncbi:hypothetical protein HPB49_011630 [Dermacentor silvarum]|uniref:Uncharacterized protein n=1 Tax=Dermacentor silvarum TaxID=543639 RepID=A0ACB8C3B9_DERSI|nr:WD repeat-containing protein 25 [Dermacentor silvarum]KAH7933343.1 hypothetical protein HPB49_011630 [Dermacentor silvarum]
MCESESSSDDGDSSDFLGLKDSDWDSKLQEATDKAYEFLKADLALRESATELVTKDFGPAIESQPQPANEKRLHSSRYPNLKRTSESSACFAKAKQAKLETKQDDSLPAKHSASPRGALDTSIVLSDEGWSNAAEYNARTVTSSFRRIKAHDKALVATSWAPEPFGKLLLTASHDGHVKLWQSTTGKCVYDLPSEDGIRSARFTLCGRRLLRCGWDRQSIVVDPTSNAVVFSCRPSQGLPTCVRLDPSNESTFFVGSRDVAEQWDMRRSPAGMAVRTFSVSCGEVLDLLPLRGGLELACSGDLVTRDSCEAALSVWDVGSGARLSGQLYQERYTIPCLESLSPNTILAQTNGDYIAMFHAERPYRLNKRKRFEGHKVSGHPVRCTASPDGALICSGDAEGVPHIYSARHVTAVGVVSLTGDNTPATHPDWHPSRPGLLSIGCADGYVHLCR